MYIIDFSQMKNISENTNEVNVYQVVVKLHKMSHSAVNYFFHIFDLNTSSIQLINERGQKVLESFSYIINLNKVSIKINFKLTEIRWFIIKL